MACNQPVKEGSNNEKSISPIGQLMEQYWQDRMQLYPYEATAYGDNRYNDQYTITISSTFRDSVAKFYQKYLDKAQQLDTVGMSEDDLLNKQLFVFEMKSNLDWLQFPTHYLPISQFWSFTLEFPQYGSGSGNQPFKTVQDYDHWLKRMKGFTEWTDTAIANMRQGIAHNWVLPKALVVKILPQLNAVAKASDTNSIFYGPIKSMPDSFSAADKERLTVAYKAAIKDIVQANYAKLAQFFQQEYLPKSRTTTGVSAMDNGTAYYNMCIRSYTTTSLSADSIYNLGLSEVARIEQEMLKVKEQTGFKGSLLAFFEMVQKDARFFPFTTPQQVLDSFWAIKKMEDPLLKNMFNKVPKTQFTIRQTEAFRAASASAEYNQGSEDGTRPGIFYVPILDAKKFNATGMATLFLHEAIPGHHYQISLQQESKGLPTFRRFASNSAYVEGWAHYCETLGTGLGLYNDPYQYLGHLGDAQHRAIRLVVDIGMHLKGMSREDAIKYMMTHESISQQDATAEIERYMAIPGQALSYKIGQMTILLERKHYEETLGKAFNLASFHDEVLKDGCVPLNVLQAKLAKWAQKQH